MLAAAYIKADGTRARGQEEEERATKNVGHLGQSSLAVVDLGCNQSTDERAITPTYDMFLQRNVPSQRGEGVFLGSLVR